MNRTLVFPIDKKGNVYYLDPLELNLDSLTKLVNYSLKDLDNVYIDGDKTYTTDIAKSIEDIRQTYPEYSTDKIIRNVLKIYECVQRFVMDISDITVYQADGPFDKPYYEIYEGNGEYRLITDSKVIKELDKDLRAHKLKDKDYILSKDYNWVKYLRGNFWERRRR